MEIAQLHSFEELTLPIVRTALQGVLLPEFLHRRAAMEIAITGPWRPADLWPGAPERALWTVAFRIPRDTLLSPRGEERLRRGIIERRLAPAHPAEFLARALGNGFVCLFSDAASFCYTLVWRERHLRSSVMLEERVRLVRCDGVEVRREEPPKRVHEGDRTGILLEGLRRWLAEPLPVPEEEVIFVPDVLGGLFSEAEWAWAIRDGMWCS